MALPIVATPAPAGDELYVVALEGAADTTRTFGLYRYSITQGGPAVSLYAGDALVYPTGIATGTLGQSIYVADSAHEGLPPSEVGGIWVFPVTGGDPSLLLGGRIRGLTVKDENATDVIYFTRMDGDGAPRVSRITSQGSNLQDLWVGAPLVDPSGIALTAEGEVYVADTFNDGATRTTSVFHITNGVATPLPLSFRTGTPCGVALSVLEEVLYVSALDASGQSAVRAVDLLQLTTVEFATSGNEPAGLQRAHDLNVFSWVDLGGNIMVLQ
ncbi:MAG: hypothetical protein AB2A00_13655 [Myxococcota bacterium]